MTLRTAPRSMLYLALMWLQERPVRAFGLVITLGVAVLAWVVLSALASPFLASKAGEALDVSLGIRNARVLGEGFPLRYAQRIEQMPDVAEVRYLRMAAFLCADNRTTVSVNAFGGSGTTTEVRRKGASAADIETWQATRNGLMVDHELAQQCGFTRGMNISPREFLSGGGEMPFEIIAILPKAPDADGAFSGKLAYAHYDYVNEMNPEQKRDQLFFMTARSTDSTRLPQLAAAIEREFADADPPLEASTSSGSSSALGRYGQVQALLGLVMLAMVACALLVFLTVLAHLTSQRRAGMATLQTIGFGRSVQFGGLILELAGIILVGTVVGLLAGRAALAAITPQLFWMTGELRTPDWALWSLAPALLALIILTLAWPALQVSKLKPIDHLRM